MTLEEKARAYDKALEIARKSWFDNQEPGYKHYREFLESMFRELREDEDEKIVNWLIRLINTGGYRELESDPMPCLRGKMVAYLEKLKEQKPNYCHHEVDETGWTEEYRKAYYDGWNNCNQQHSQLKAEQNPTWSEKDKEMVLKISTFIKTKLSIRDENDSIYIGSDMVRWIKSLQERFGLQPKIEWSEKNVPSREMILAIWELGNEWKET